MSEHSGPTELETKAPCAGPKATYEVVGVHLGAEGTSSCPNPGGAKMIVTP